jgi:hypothetical protein
MGDDDDVPTGTRWACFRHSIIGHLLASPPAAGELGAALDALASRTWVHPTTGDPMRIGRSTIERWLYLARDASDPMGALSRKRHAQLGKHPSMGPGMRHALEILYAGHRSWSRRLLYDNVQVIAETEAGIRPVPSYATVCRYMADAGHERGPRPCAEKPGQKVAREAFERRETRCYEASHVGGLWHADFHDGSRKVLVGSGEWIVPQLLATLDDRSRLVCHAQWYATEDVRTYVHGKIQALSKRGLPRRDMSDLGSAMKAAETRRGLSSLSIEWMPTLPYSPEQNGKQEVFWAQIEGRLLPMLDDVEVLTLGRLNDATTAWVEYEYNRKVHSETGQTPLARFLDGPTVLRESPGSESLRDAFRQRVTRRVRRSDGTLTVRGVRYEVPSRFRQLREVGVLFARWDMARVTMLDPRTDDALCPLYPVDMERNADGLRRLRQPIDGAHPLPEPHNEPDREAPLLRKCMAEYAATGMPLAYVPDDTWPSDAPETWADENDDDDNDNDEKED